MKLFYLSRSHSEEIYFDLQITGEFVCVQDALYNVTGRLRDNLFPSRMSNGAGTRGNSSLIPETMPYERAIAPSSLGWHSSVGVPHNFNRHTTLTQSIDHHGLPYGYDCPPSPRLWASQVTVYIFCFSILIILVLELLPNLL